jgi:hypothetical protein
MINLIPDRDLTIKDNISTSKITKEKENDKNIEQVDINFVDLNTNPLDIIDNNNPNEIRNRINKLNISCQSPKNSNINVNLQYLPPKNFKFFTKE